MSKHFSCKDCCKYQTDACDNPKYAESGKHLCPFYVLDIEDCYQKGRADMQDWVEKRCKELGIDYIAIFTCNSGD